MGKIIFVNRFYSPDHSATAQILTDLADALAEAGHPVHILTSNGLYDNDRIELPERENMKGVEIHRVATARSTRHNLGRRAFGYLSVYRAFYRAIQALAEPGDVVIAKTDPPLLSVVIERALRKRGITFVNWLQDLYPEVAIELNVPFLKWPLTQIITSLRDRSLKAAQMNVVLGGGMAKRVKDCGVQENAIALIPNWSQDEEIYPIEHCINPLRLQWNLQDKFVVAYSGNLGRAHEFETLLSAANHLRYREDIKFLFIGSGHHMERLNARVKLTNLNERFQFRPYQDESMLKYSLSVADVHWLSLLPALEGLIVPSKFYGIAAAGRPTLAVTAREGEIGRIVREHRCGIQIDPGDSKALSEAILRLADDGAYWRSLCQNARALVDSGFNRKQSIGAWDRLLRTVTDLKKVADVKNLQGT